MSALTIIVCGALVAALVWIVAVRAPLDSERLTVAVALGVAAAAFNIVVPIPNVEVTTVAVMCIAATLGIVPAVLAAGIAVVGTSVTGGFGPWTAWQLVGFATIAAMAAAWSAAARTRRRPITPVHIAILTAVAVPLYDAALTITGTSVIVAGEGWGDAVTASLLLGLPFTVLHTVACVAITLAFAPGLLRALVRLDRIYASADVQHPHVARSR